MRHALTEVVEGWTAALPFTLKGDGDPVDLTGLTVAVLLKDARGVYLRNDTTAGVSVTNATGGEIEYTPASSSEFVARWTPYKIRFRVSDGSSDRVFFPNEDEDVIKVNVP